MNCVCGHLIEPMFPYLTLTVNNTDAPEHTVYRFDSENCYKNFKRKNKGLFALGK